MIDDNPDEMIGKRYMQVDGLVDEEFGIGDIAIVTKYYGITSLGAEKFSKIRLGFNGFEVWREVKEPVDFMTAFIAWNESCKTITCELDGSKYMYDKTKDAKFYASQIARGKWYIED